MAADAPDTPRRIVLVGHCGPDMFMLKTAVSRAVPSAAIEIANEQASLEQYRNDHAVLLVNRVLDGSFSTDSGIDLIGELTKDDGAPVCMLVSNFPEAQEEAVANGARPGFGKSQLYDERTSKMLREAASVC
jgi:hypothetical protein